MDMALLVILGWCCVMNCHGEETVTLHAHAWAVISGKTAGLKKEYLQIDTVYGKEALPSDQGEEGQKRERFQLLYGTPQPEKRKSDRIMRDGHRFHFVERLS